MSNNIMFEVTITLSRNQYRGNDKWWFTDDGKEKLITCQKIKFMIDNLDDLSRRINPFQTDKIKIRRV